MALKHSTFIVETTLVDIKPTLEENQIMTPAIIVIGPVNQYREAMDWYSKDLKGNGFG